MAVGRRLMPVGLWAATVDAESDLDALLALVDRDCGFRRLVDDLGLDSHAELDPYGVDHDSFADRVACDGRKDIVEILVDTAACDRRMELSEDPGDIQDRRHAAVLELQQFPFLDGEQPSHLVVESTLLGYAESALEHSELAESE